MNATHSPNELSDASVKKEENRESIPVKKTRAKRQPVANKCLKTSFFEDDKDTNHDKKGEYTYDYEMGMDEVGRGPMFGRVYAAAAILPKDFDHSQMKDSKKFHSKKKIVQVAEYIKSHAIAYSIQYEDESVIDSINILQASQSAMHKCVSDIMKTTSLHNHSFHSKNTLLLVDGNYFNPHTKFNKDTGKIEQIHHKCVEGGDNTYSSIAAASILAKVARDQYIDDLCAEHPELAERYSIDTNKGYGSKKHMDGIKQFGITQWHRKSFGICAQFA